MGEGGIEFQPLAFPLICTHIRSRFNPTFGRQHEIADRHWVEVVSKLGESHMRNHSV